ncbi:MAG TPA: hypothetical protein PLX38_04025 [Gammaproteobacteria bacterium]|nr:hypothetical protein [Gammaproteobacteria bacterium]
MNKKIAKKDIKKIDRDYENISKNSSVLLSLVGFCGVIIWRSFDLFKVDEKINDSNELFFISFVLSSICLLFLFFSWFSLFLDKDKVYRKPLSVSTFLMSLALASLSMIFVIFQVYRNVAFGSDFAKIFPFLLIPSLLLIFGIMILVKVKRYKRKLEITQKQIKKND